MSTSNCFGFETKHTQLMNEALRKGGYDISGYGLDACA